MASGYRKALLDVSRAFRHAPVAARLHVLIRFLTCPFLRAIDLIPSDSTLLDVGTGHGVLAVLAATRRNARVTGVDPDIRKLLTPLSHRYVRMVAGHDTAVRGQFDAVALFDVIYRMGPQEREELFGRLMLLLRPGGTLVIKEINPAKRLKSGWNRIQEWVAERLGLTLGQGVFAESAELLQQRLERQGFISFEARDIDRWYPHPHVVYTARKPGAETAAR